MKKKAEQIYMQMTSNSPRQELGGIDKEFIISCIEKGLTEVTSEPERLEPKEEAEMYIKAYGEIYECFVKNNGADIQDFKNAIIAYTESHNAEARLLGIKGDIIMMKNVGSFYRYDGEIYPF